jgi:hypothetical protein
MLKRKVAISGIAALSVAAAFSAGAWADTVYKQITAYQNPAITIKVNGNTVDLSSDEGMMYPLIYDGHSYVSARALAEAMGGTVAWNAETQTVEVTTGSIPSGALPSKDNSKASPPPKPTQTPAPTAKPSAGSAASTNTGSLSDPIKLGSSFTYSENVADTDISYSAVYTVTVKSAKSITRDEIEGLGFSRPRESLEISYMMVELAVKVKDAKFKQGTSSMTSFYLSQYLPSIWGSKLSDDSDYLIGGTEFGFDGSLEDQASDVTDFAEVYPGDTKGYEVSGKVLLPVLSGKTNYLVIQNRTTDMDYDASMIHFKLN